MSSLAGGPTLFGIDPEGARLLAADVRAWGTRADDVMWDLNDAILLSQLDCTAPLLLDQLITDWRTIAAAIVRAVDEVESHVLAADWQVSFEVQQTTDAITSIRDRLTRADLLVDSGDQWWYVAESAQDQAQELQRQAWQQAIELGVNPAWLFGVLTGDQPAPSDHDLARGLELGRAQRLWQTADQLHDPTLRWERDQMRLDALTILNGLFSDAEAQAIVSAASPTLDPLSVAVLVDYAAQPNTDGVAVASSRDPLRVLELVVQGYTEEAAIDFVATSPAGTPSYAELEARLAHLDRNHGTNTAEYDAILRQLDEHTIAVTGALYAQADLTVVRVADRMGLDHARALLVVTIDQMRRIHSPSNNPAERLSAIDASLVTYLQLRHQQAIQDHEQTLADQAHTMGPHLPLDPPQLLEPEAAARRLRAMLMAGAPIGLAEGLNPMLLGASPGSAAAVVRTIAGLSDDGHGLEESAMLGVNAFRIGLDVDEVTALVSDELDLQGAWELRAGAHMGAMSVEDYQALLQVTDPEIMAVLDTVRGGGPDGRFSLLDLNYTIDYGDELDLPPTVIDAAIAFRSRERLMIRLDTARDFNQGVVGHEPFGRAHADDFIWSEEDFGGFWYKQGLNFALSDHVDLIDTYAHGGDLDGHLSQIDFQAVADSAEELGLTAAEVEAINAVIQGELYDKNWVETHRDSIALAAAIVAGIAVSVASLGVGSVAAGILINSIAAAATYSATVAAATTIGINMVTGEDTWDGVIENTIQGGFAGVAVGTSTGLATNGIGQVGATHVDKLLGLTSLIGEGFGIVSIGAADWILAPTLDLDEIELANVHQEAGQVSLILETSSFAGGRVLAAAENQAVSLAEQVALVNNGLIKSEVINELGQPASFDPIPAAPDE